MNNKWLACCNVSIDQQFHSGIPCANSSIQ
ncbi:hypothetical protein CIPAW_03G276200 [Carya illinoinensis]|uniref:Uncharacterized protein n=1 Tax=Carya illinoinensis TaxID=32201 RepID=A0A8T1R8F1_CARIL|nr:hypothetical protein CIPAW_03G276200 [Carya illinoinensis]